MSETSNKSENNLKDLQTSDENVNQLNDLKITSSDDQRSDYESCGESSEQQIDRKSVEESEEEEVLSEEEIQKRKEDSIQLKSEGNQYFKQQMYEKSIEFYTKALDLCPKQLSNERSVIYANRSAARIHCLEMDGALEDSNIAIDLNPTYVKAILRRAQIYRQKSEKLDDSLKDYERVIQLDPNCTEAINASNQLKIEINERNERMKTEMMSKLKDLGNLVLRPFGLSTDNFKMSQNPETGGYSVNFQNN